MRNIHRVMTVAVLGAFAIGLSACTDFDPDKLDVFHLNEKKKLPGERKELFPGGVPGVTQGIPPEYVKGNQPAPETAQVAQPDQPQPAEGAQPDTKKTAAVEAVSEPKPKAKPKHKSTRPPPEARSPQQASGQAQPAPWPQQDQQPQPQQSQSPWPAPQGQASSTAPWPSAPQPGTFSR